MNFFISDLHFGHKNGLAFDNRPFDTIEEHDAELIKRWNNKVNVTDDVYILGDISWHNATKTINIFNQLNGIKHLIVGNHDTKLLRNQDIRSLFIEICDYKELYLTDKISVILCHYPIVAFKNHYYGWYHFYGHVHNGWEENIIQNVIRQNINLYDKSCNMINVGAMIPYMSYAPLSFTDLAEIIEKRNAIMKKVEG